MNKPPIKKRKTDVKEDIGTLQFGDDFNDGPDVEALLNSDVKIILETTLGADPDSNLDEQSDMFQNSLSYCKKAGRFQDIESAMNCKNELMNKSSTGGPIEAGRWGGQALVSFEAAALGNLQPSNAEEAKSLIKSLQRFSDQEVEEMCQIVQRFKAT